MPDSQRGEKDPNQRKIVGADNKRISHMASEARSAMRLASVLHNSLERANHPTEAIEPILKSITTWEKRLVDKIEPGVKLTRQYKKKRGPEQKDRPIVSFFLDESGKPQLYATEKKGKKIHENTLRQLKEPFVLSGVAMTNSAMEAYNTRANEIKEKYEIPLGTSFHDPDMRKGMEDFRFEGKDEAYRQTFLEEMRSLVRDSDFTAFAVAIRKDFYLEELKNREIGSIVEIDPHLPTEIYELGIFLIMERFISFMHSSQASPMPKITFEAQGGKENAVHQRAMANLQIHGTRFVTDSEFRQYLEPGCLFRPKSGTNPLELADIVARDVFEWTKSNFTVKPLFWDILDTKWYKNGNRERCQFGLKVFPDFDLRTMLLEHRRNCGE